jgi:predicted HicB family RNase H-like nuclease
MEKYMALQIPEDLHTAAKERAAHDKMTLKQFVIAALEAAVRKEKKK